MEPAKTETERKLTILADILTEKVEENVFLQDKNAALLLEIQHLNKFKKKNKLLRSKVVKLRLENESLKNSVTTIVLNNTESSESESGDNVQLLEVQSKLENETNNNLIIVKNLEAKLLELQLRLETMKTKKNSYKDLVAHYAEEIEDIKLNEEMRRDKEYDKIKKNSKENDPIVLRVRLKEAQERIHSNELSMELLKLYMEKTYQKKVTYKELQENYKCRIIRSSLDGNCDKYDNEDVITLKFALVNAQQKCLSYKESIVQYEKEIYKINNMMHKNVNVEVKARVQYANELEDLKEKMKLH